MLIAAPLVFGPLSNTSGGITTAVLHRLPRTVHGTFAYLGTAVGRVEFMRLMCRCLLPPNTRLPVCTCCSGTIAKPHATRINHHSYQGSPLQGRRQDHRRARVYR